jgi:MoaA/NifB/PqqE/SkfB family radical SAM enzyme
LKGNPDGLERSEPAASAQLAGKPVRQSPMMVQFEITTRCNFDCFYCAGRLMRQDDMAYEMFSDILMRHIARYGLPDTVSLQGEGEPTLHPDFFRMAALVREIGSQPYTITNGSYKHPEHFEGVFDQVGVSVDTLDEAAATQIGRYNLPRVRAFALALAPHGKVFIHSVAHQDHTPAIAEWCHEHGFKHIVQPLQTKADYSRRYMKQAPVAEPAFPFSCSYLAQPRMRYYDLDGIEMPCCYIKETGTYEGLDAMLQHQQAGTWATCCVGCRYAVAQPPR